MIIAIIIILALLAIALAGMFYVAAVHYAIKKEYEQEEILDNSEFDYGHDVRHTEREQF